MNYSDFSQVFHCQSAMIAGAMHSTPSAALNVMLNILPLDEYLTKEAILGSNRIQTQGYWLKYKGRIGSPINHRSICEGYISEIPELIMPNDKIPMEIIFRKKFTTVIEPRDLFTLDTTLTSSITCWTDGSKLDTGYSGSGVFFESENYGNHSWFTPLGRYSTVFQTEVHAI